MSSDGLITDRTRGKHESQVDETRNEETERERAGGGEEAQAPQWNYSVQRMQFIRCRL